MCVIMNIYFHSSLINMSAVTIFILGFLLQVQTSIQQTFWTAVLKDLNLLKSYSEIDATLYTANISYLSDCNKSVMECFHLELKVIWYESSLGGDKNFYDIVHRVQRNVQNSLLNIKDVETPKCQKCETFEEKKYTDFIQNFIIVLQQLNRKEREQRL